MRYFKNKELILTYNVSEKTIRNWIATSKSGKLDLKLYEAKGRTYIADSTANNHLLEKLALNSRKYRNSRNHRTISPTPKFYKLFNSDQIIDFANILETKREISWHYSYFGHTSASYWDTYLSELYESSMGNLITNTINTIDLQTPYVDAIVQNYSHINIVNVCIGNNLAVRNTVSHYLESGKLRRFISLDISDAVLNIARKNTQQWFDGKLTMETHTLDIRHASFGNIIHNDTFGEDASKTISLIFLVAGPLVNFHNPQQVLRNIQDSMDQDSLLFVTHKRDTKTSRKFFDFNIRSDPSLSGRKVQFLIEMLGMDESLYDFEVGYNPEARKRFERLRLKKSLSVTFKSGNFQKTVSFQKGEHINLWHCWQYTDQESIDLLTQSGFNVLQSSQSLDGELISTISKVAPVITM